MQQALLHQARLSALSSAARLVRRRRGSAASAALACTSSAAANPVQQPEEQVVIVDAATNAVVGSATRSVLRAFNLPHRSTFIFLHKSDGQLFVQQRVSWKETYPSHSDPAPGGVVGAGESYELNAERELEEEMGVRGAPLQALFDFWFEDERTRVWGRAFRAIHDGPLTLQPSEVAGGAWMSLREAQELSKSQPCCPDSLVALAEYVRRLDAGELPLVSAQG